MALNYDEVKPLSHETQQIFKEILINGGYTDTNFQKIKNNLGRWGGYSYTRFGVGKGRNKQVITERDAVAYIYDTKGEPWFIKEGNYLAYMRDRKINEIVSGVDTPKYERQPNCKLEIGKVYKLGDKLIAIKDKTAKQAHFVFVYANKEYYNYAGESYAVGNRVYSFEMTNRNQKYFLLRLDINNNWAYKRIVLDSTVVGQKI